jgi:hypothetical protein
MELRIQTEGLTFKEVLELEKLMESLDSVQGAKFTPVLPGTMERRSFPSPQATITTLHLVFRLAKGGAQGVGAAAGIHIYKKIGEGVVDKVWDAVRAKLTGKSVAEVEVKLYGPDGELIKQHKGRR